jgi:hypothetical protein
MVLPSVMAAPTHIPPCAILLTSSGRQMNPASVWYLFNQSGIGHAWFLGCWRPETFERLLALVGHDHWVSVIF